MASRSTRNNNCEVENDDEHGNSDTENDMNGDNNKLTCPKCNADFAHKSSLSRHMQKHKVDENESNDIQTHTCSICLKTFDRKDNLLKHTKKKKRCSPPVENNEKWKCPDCPQAFKKKSNLTRHAKVHEKKTQFVCTVRGCSKVYTRQNFYEAHLKSHKTVEEGAGTASRNESDIVDHENEDDNVGGVVDQIRFPLTKRLHRKRLFDTNNSKDFALATSNNIDLENVDENFDDTDDFSLSMAVSSSSYSFVPHDEGDGRMGDVEPHDEGDGRMGDVDFHNEGPIESLGQELIPTMTSSAVKPIEPHVEDMELSIDGEENIVEVVPDYMDQELRSHNSTIPDSTTATINPPMTPKTPLSSIKIPQTPNTRKRKSRVATEIANFVRNLQLGSVEEEAAALKLAVQQLGQYDRIWFERKPCKRGRKMTSKETRQKAWDWWHNEEYMTESTLTSRPARMHVKKKPKIQEDLKFKVPITKVLKRNRECYEAQWLIFQNTIRELYCKYVKANPNHIVSMGTFLALKPFYVRTATAKDIEMCVCKLHLHGRWSIKSLVTCCKENEIDIGNIVNYETLLENLTSNCECDAHAYIGWKCTPDKNTLCPHVKKNWEELKDTIMNKKPEKEVSFTQFVKKPHVTKKGKEIQRLEQEVLHVGAEYIIQFIEERLSKVIHHRNQLKNFRNVVHTFNSLFDAVDIDIDFSEKLKVPVKKEPQSLHWTSKEVIVHSGILKKDGNKEYHCYLSNDLIQDHAFVNMVLDEMLESIDHNQEFIIINSDNCSAQYKCSAHFHKLQSLAEHYKKTVIRVYGIAGHGKGEVDHVGGLTKVAVRREVAAGRKLLESESIVKFLIEKFGDKSHPTYTFKNITSEDLEEERSEARFIKYITVKGSSKFQVLVFNPGQKMKAATRLCICSQCKVLYGSCSLFKEYELVAHQLKRMCLRSGPLSEENLGIDKGDDDEEENEEAPCEILLPGTVVALAADLEAPVSFYLLKITKEEEEKDEDVDDGFGHVIRKGVKHFEGIFLERKFDSDTKYYFPRKPRTAYFYKESVILPSVQLTEKKTEFVMTDDELLMILQYVDRANQVSLF